MTEDEIITQNETDIEAALTAEFTGKTVSVSYDALTKQGLVSVSGSHMRYLFTEIVDPNSVVSYFQSLSLA